MLTDPKTLFKCRRIESTYEPLIFEEVGIVDLEGFETDDHLRTVPGDEQPWRPVAPGHRWGKAWANAWFRGCVDVSPEQAAKNLFIRAGLGAVETMLFVDEVARGIYSSELEVGARGHHHTLMLHAAG